MNPTRQRRSSRQGRIVITIDLAKVGAGLLLALLVCSQLASVGNFALHILERWR